MISFIFSILFALLSLVNTAPISASTNSSSNQSPIEYYYQNGIQGACSWWSKDTDLVVGLPVSFYPDYNGISSHCGSKILISTLDNRFTVVATVADASAGNELSLSIATWKALGGEGTALNTVNWRFVDSGASTPSSTSSAATSTVSIISTSTSTRAHHSASHTRATPSSSTSTSVASTSYSAPAAPSTTSTYSTPPPPPPSSTYSSSTSTSSQSSSDYVAPSPTPSAEPQPLSAGSGNYLGQATFFYQQNQAGACGTVHADSDYVVALDTGMYGLGSHCGKSIKIYNGRGNSITCLVADECPSCSSSTSIDLSVAAFNALGSEDAGVLEISWSFA